MNRPGLSIEGALIWSVLFLWLGRHYWILLRTQSPERSFMQWALKGFAAPALAWLFLNTGWWLPPIIPGIDWARRNGINWPAEYFQRIGPGLWVIGSCWAAATFGWLAYLVYEKEEFRGDFTRAAKIMAVAGLLSALVLLRLYGIPAIGLCLLIPLAGAVHLVRPERFGEANLPSYSGAVAKMKFGKYVEAEEVVLGELEKCEEDFDGWMLLAELHATQFNDMAQAEQLVRDLCDQPNLNALQISMALQRLADWHLKLAGDPAAARGALETLCEKLPGTHAARMARQRMARLPATREEWAESRRARTIRLPAVGDNLDEPAAPQSEQERSQAAALANESVERLKRDPNDVPAREKFARLLAERLDRPALAIEQVQLLLEMPDQPGKRRAEWLSWIAGWHLRYRLDREAASVVLRRLIAEHPDSVQAFAAQRRLNLLEMEEMMRRRSEGKANARRT